MFKDKIISLFKIVNKIMRTTLVLLYKLVYIMRENAKIKQNRINVLRKFNVVTSPLAYRVG